MTVERPEKRPVPMAAEVCERCGKVTERPRSVVRKFCGDECRFAAMSALSKGVWGSR